MQKKIKIFSLLFLVKISSFAQMTGEQIYQTKCNFCHNGTIKEAPRIESLQLLSSNAIVKALQSGVMKVQGSTLSKKEHELVAEFISKIGKEKNEVIAGKCAENSKENASKTVVGNWGMGLNNARFVNKNIGINAANVAKLSLKWVFAFPESTRARCQPTLAGNTIFTSNQNGLIYALDKNSGCIRWTFQAENEVRSSLVIGSDKNGFANRLYFSDFKANVYALDLKNQKLLWKKRVDDHEQATITGTLSLFNGHLYVPVSSTEIVNAMNPKYQCCTFRGSVVALNEQNGDLIWKTYTTEEPKPQGFNKSNTQNFAPSGAPVWSSLTIINARLPLKLQFYISEKLIFVLPMLVVRASKGFFIKLLPKIGMMQLT